MTSRYCPSLPPCGAKGCGAFRLSAVSAAAILAATVLPSAGILADTAGMLIDDFSDPSLTSALGSTWRSVSDSVMGGVSQASVSHEATGEGTCLRLTGEVRLDNNGGFVQAALDLAADGGDFDASAFTGISLTARGNGEQYSVHLRTADLERPWQSYRAHFVARPETKTFTLAFAQFEPHRTSVPLDTTRLRRIGLVAIGRPFHADLAVCRLGFYS